jgi:putative oxidoreductase
MTHHESVIATFGRLLIAAIFLFSGVGKILAPTMTQAYIAAAALPLPLAAYLIAIVVEIGGSILLILGFKARLVAMVMATFSVATAFSFHHNFVDPDQQMHFLKNISMAGGLLQVAAFGAGALSLDARLAVPSAQADKSSGSGLLTEL